MPSEILVVFARAFVTAVYWAFTIAIFTRVLTSWVPNLRLPFGLSEFVWSVSEPVLGPIRRALPFMGGLDFSPFIALFAIQAVSAILLSFIR